MNPMWLIRAKRLAQNPPSMGKVKLVIGIICVCLLIYAAEQVWGWPEWLTPNDMRNRVLK